MDPTQAKVALNKGLMSLIAAEPDITRYDTVVGDGDCGVGMKRGAEGSYRPSVRRLRKASLTNVSAIIKHLESQGASDDAFGLVSRLARVVEESMDGTSGALYT